MHDILRSIYQDNQTQHWLEQQDFPHTNQRVAAANFSKQGQRRRQNKRAKREGRRADTSSCGATALQRKCDTFPNHLSEDNRGMGASGHRWTALNEFEQPSTHVHNIPVFPIQCLLPLIQPFNELSMSILDIMSLHVHISHLPEVNLHL